MIPCPALRPEASFLLHQKMIQIQARIACVLQSRYMRAALLSATLTLIVAVSSSAQTATRADILRGEYGRYRANNDLLEYRLDVRVDPEKKSISGKNEIRFRMLSDDTRIQLDLYD